jgi:hypothetical protein
MCTPSGALVLTNLVLKLLRILRAWRGGALHYKQIYLMRQVQYRMVSRMVVHFTIAVQY